jgi:HPt (histidine-containing phosphotransfer) domain-containing protein
MSDSNAAPLVDFEQLDSACDNDADLKKELVNLYFTQADQIMRDLQKAIQDRSIDDVNHLAHKLAGSSLACGMSAIVASVRQLEMDAKAGIWNEPEVYYATAAERLEVMRGYMNKHFSQTPGA